MYVHSNHIPQPPHSAGLQFEGLRPRINPSQVPSPIETAELDRLKWEDQAYGTLHGTYVPASTSEFIAIDQGNSSPKFVRVTTWNIPNTSYLASQCQIPIAAVFQPFAELDPLEEPIPLVDTGETGPARCEQCRAYVNPWCVWVAGGTLWKCNLCGHETKVSSEYYCALDANLMRLDHLQRPELNKGTIEFTVPNEYWAIHPPESIIPPFSSVDPPHSGLRRPEPVKYIFAFDVSTEAIESGFLRSSCACVDRILYGGTDVDDAPIDACFPPESSLAIITYDRTIHFYDLSIHSSDQARMMVVSDIEEVFLPLKRGLFENPRERRSIIESLIKALPGRFESNPTHESALGSLLRSCQAALAGHGGQVIVFSSTMPTVGIGKLSGQPSETELFDTEKEVKLNQPREDIWTSIGQDCAAEGIGVNMILSPNKYIDIGSIGAVASLTGGDLIFHPRFDPARDEIVLDSQLQRLVRRNQGYNCIMRIRCSNGLQLSGTYYGNFYQSSSANLEFGALDADKAISVVLEHSGKSLTSRDNVYLQSSLLYTTVTGQRRARICNMSLQVAELAANVFRYADLDTTVCHFVREAMFLRRQQKTAALREDLTEKCASILFGYRKYCAAATRIDQLILPEAFKALPSYILALMKSKPLKGLLVSSDVRNYHAHRMNSLPIRNIIHSLYPQLLALHDLDDVIALPNELGQMKIPSSMRDSYTFMDSHGIYLIDNEETAVFWIGHSVSPQLLIDLFGVDEIMLLSPGMTRLPILESRLSIQVRNVLIHRQKRRKRIPKIYFARQNLDAAELEFSDMLVEDSNNANLSYTDYLALVHKQISHVLKNGGSLSGASTMRGSPW